MSWTDAENNALLKLLAVVLELTGSEWSAVAVKVAAAKLESFPAKQVKAALERCATECKFKLTLADIVSRIDDGRPGAEEAWGAFPKSEHSPGVVTDEMSVAWGAAEPLFKSDEIAARMAFREVYEREVRAARAAGTDPVWTLSPGFNHKATEALAIEAVKLGKLTPRDVEPYVLPENRPAEWPALLPSSAEEQRLLGVSA